jgi:hypothetical protein
MGRARPAKNIFMRANFKTPGDKAENSFPFRNPAFFCRIASIKVLLFLTYPENSVF